MVQSCGGVQLILVCPELCDVVLRKLCVPCILQLQKFCCVVQMNGTGLMYTFMPCVLHAVWFKELELVQRILQCPNFCSLVQRNGTGSTYTCRSRVLHWGTKKSLDSMDTLMSSVLQCGTKWW